MTHVVCEPCVNCKYTDCAVVCPVSCFYEGNNMLAIHPVECIDCTLCVPVCPTKAIFAEPDVPSQWQEFVEINARLSQSGEWPQITTQKECMGHLEDGRSKRELLDEGPYTG
jgi:ferredoxin